MTDTKLDVFFHEDVLSMRCPDGLFEKAASPLLAYQMPFAEGPERIANIVSILKRAPSADRFVWHDGRHATDAEILSYHTREYLDDLERADTEGKWYMPSTYLPAGGLRGVKAGAGTVMAALEHILQGEARRAYALVRPPSHHAAPAVADGYCFLNAVGMAAITAQTAGLQRIAVVDWDVHHGNGTQEGFYDQPSLLNISIHMDHRSWDPNTHPQSGSVEEIGVGDGAGYNLNLPLPFGVGDFGYTELIRTVVVPALSGFRPDLVIVSNGQDAGQFDPNGRQLLTAAGFHQMASLVSDAAHRLCDGRVLIVQEGGYNPAHACFCAYASLLGFLGLPLDVEDPLSFYPEDHALSKAAISSLIRSHPLLDKDGRWVPSARSQA